MKFKTEIVIFLVLVAVFAFGVATGANYQWLIEHWNEHHYEAKRPILECRITPRNEYSFWLYCNGAWHLIEFVNGTIYIDGRELEK